MINTMDGFLRAYEECFSVGLAPDAEPGECYYEDLQAHAREPFEGKLIGQMENLGILYTFGGMLVINAMAIRVLKRIRGSGKELTDECFRHEIAVSRDLYHLDEEAELAP